MAEATMEKAETPERRDLMSRWFGDVAWPRFGEFFRPEMWPRLESPMKVEEFREGAEFVVRVEVPGIDPDKDVEMFVSDHTLRIRAERKEEEKTEEKGRYRSEFHYGSYSRSIPLPSGASAEDVKATYKDGILEVRLPVGNDQAETKQIPVRRG